MGLLRYAAVGAAGFIGYKLWQNSQGDGEHTAPAAFAPGQSVGQNPAPVRDAGPDAMRDQPRHWTVEDQQSDESFPASDPPGNY